MRRRIRWATLGLSPLLAACATGETIDDLAAHPDAAWVDASEAGSDAGADAASDAPRPADASADADATADAASEAGASADAASEADATADGASEADAIGGADGPTDADAASGDASEAGGHDAGASCALPAAACANGAQSGYSCGSISSGATVIGRSAAKQAGGFATAASSDLCSFASNNIDVAGCDDSGNDHVYRVFLRAGERVTVTTTASACPSSTATARLTLFQTTTDCSNPTSSACLTAAPAVACATSPQTYVAPSDGWVAIVVDSSVAGDGVVYALEVALDASSCAVAGCECP